MKGNFIVKVAPLIRLPLGKTQVFSYWSPASVSQGSLIQVPFRTNYISGIVISGSEKFVPNKNFKYKKVGNIIEESFLDEKQIELAQKLAERCISPLGTVLKAMLPNRVKFRSRKSEPSVKGLDAPKRIMETLNNIWESKNREFVLEGSMKERQDICMSLIARASRKKGQCLVLVSEIFSARAMESKFKLFFQKDEIAVLHSGVGKGEFYANWQRIKKGQARIVIGTKIGVFLPFRNLKLVVIEEDQDISFKQWDMSPRYWAPDAAKMLAGLHGAKVVFSGSSISAYNWKLAQEKKMRFAEFSPDRGKNPRLAVINLFEEKKSPDFPITKELYASLAKVVDQRKKALLIVNRRGYSRFTLCQKCKNILRCPDCERALVYFDELGKYCCQHCSFKADLLSACPVCGACQFSHLGTGIEMVEKKIKKFFPSAKVAKLVRDDLKNSKKTGEAMKKLSGSGPVVALGTQIALKSGNVTEFDLVGFPVFDEMGGIPDFNTREINYSLLRQAFDLLKRDGQLIVQTYSRTEDFLRDYPLEQEKTYYKREIEMRKKMYLPPFSRLIKISFREKSIKKAQTEAQKTFDLLEALSDNKTEISEPYEPMVSKKRGYFYRNILIKTWPEANFKKLPIYPVVAALGKGWAIDADPINTA